jgi:hypothetical protein
MIKYAACIVVGIAGLFVIDGCSGREPVQAAGRHVEAPPAPRPAVTNPPPAAMTEIGAAAAEIFDAARTATWPDASASLDTLRESIQTLPTSGLPPDLVAQLRMRTADLARGVKGRRRVAAMDAANSITRLAGELSSSYETAIPFKVVLLDYYGRQLELGLTASRPAMMRQAAADLRQTWNSVEPTILRRGGVEDARRFTDIVVQIEGARRPADFVAPVRAELAAVDRMQKIFTP